MSTSRIGRRGLSRAAVVCSVALISNSGLAASPEENTATPSGRGTQIPDDSVVVTASRIPEPVNDTLWSTTVITRADIDARQPSSVLELLSDVAGINVATNSTPGKLSSVFIRGAQSDHTLLLVDGVRVASATAGTAAFEFIPVEQIDHIEIVRGPLSTLYGTDAIGGVVQIFTRHAPNLEGTSFGAEGGGGSHRTRRLGADFQSRGARGWMSLGANTLETHGFNSCSSAAANVGGCFVDEPDADGYRNSSASLGAGYSLSDNWKTEVHSLLSHGTTKYDGSVFSGNETAFGQLAVDASLDGTLNEHLHARVSLGRSEDHQDTTWRNTIFPVPPSTAAVVTQVGIFNTNRDTASIQMDGVLTQNWRLIGGVDYQRDRIDARPLYDRTSRDTTGVFSELHGRLGAWSTVAGARYEDNEQFGGRVTGNAGVGRALTDRVRVTASWGTAFHAPTFNDLYYPGFNNPNLKPEESRSFELGLSGHEASTAIDWSAHVFQTTINDLIGLDSGFNVVNIDRARIRGAELQGDWHNDRWKVGGQLTRLDPINRGNDHLLPRRAKESASLEMRRSWPWISLGAVTRYEGRRYDDAANTRPLGGYATADLAAEFNIGHALIVQARAANLFDKDYQTAAFYFQDGRNFSLTLRYRFSANP